MLNFSGNSVENPKNLHCMAPGFLDIRNANEYLCGMFIKAVQKRKAGTNENPMYFRLFESYRDSSGKPCQRMIIALGYMEDPPRRLDKQELCRCPNDMALHNRHPMCDNPHIIELANHYYQKMVDSNKITPVRETEAVRILRENSALCEMLGLNPAEITKDKPYRCACRLYDLHHEPENRLSNRVRTLFGQENKILLSDLSNTYFEGRMQNSSLAKYGRSKEKRTDCKQVVPAAVVNTNGLLVRTQIYEGNKSECTTMQEVLKSVEKKGLSESEKKITVMDTGISTKENLNCLKQNNYHNITVAGSSNVRYEDIGCEVKKIRDNKGQIIRLKRVNAVSGDDTLLLVESGAKAFKEASMYERSCHLFEEGFNGIAAGILKKAAQKNGTISKNFEISAETVAFTYKKRWDIALLFKNRNKISNCIIFIRRLKTG
jgi:hypothetical protein